MMRKSIAADPKLYDYYIRFNALDSFADFGANPEMCKFIFECEIMFGDALDGKLVGKIDFSLIQTDNIVEEKNGFSPFEVFHDQGAELAYCYETLFDESGRFRESVQKTFDHKVTSRDILFVDSIELFPQHRGRGLSLLVLRKAIERFGPAGGLVCLIPAPSAPSHDKDWENKMRRLDTFVADPEMAKIHLWKHFSKLGFKRIGDSNLMACCTANGLPSVKQLGTPLTQY